MCRLHFAVLSAAAFVVSACGYDWTFDPRRNNTDDGPIDAGPNDAVANDAVANDALLDASPGFCASLSTVAGVVFCDDFDEEDRADLSTRGWAPLGAYPTGVLTTDHALSPPRGARLDFGVDASPGRTMMARNVPFPADRTEVTIHASVRTEQVFDGSSVALSFGKCSVALRPRDGRALVYCPEYFNGPVASPVPAGEWTRVALSVRRGSNDLHVGVRVGDEPSAVLAEGAIPAGAIDLGTEAGLRIGSIRDDTRGTAYFDDVWVEMR
jgi:hypothetical protein